MFFSSTDDLNFTDKNLSQKLNLKMGRNNFIENIPRHKSRIYLVHNNFLSLWPVKQWRNQVFSGEGVRQEFFSAGVEHI
jgi:hypothetical protein